MEEIQYLSWEQIEKKYNNRFIIALHPSPMSPKDSHSYIFNFAPTKEDIRNIKKYFGGYYLIGYVGKISHMEKEKNYGHYTFSIRRKLNNIQWDDMFLESGL